MARVLIGYNPKDSETKAKISEYRTLRGYSVAELIKKSGINANTYYAGMKNPERFRLCDLRSIYEVLRVPDEERKGL